MLAGMVLPVAEYPLMWLYGLSGSLAGALYALAWARPLLPSWPHLQPGPEQGELYLGAVMGLFFALSFIGSMYLG